MKTYDLIKHNATQASDGFIEADGYIMQNSTTDVDVTVIPYGDEYAAPLVTSSAPNQLSGITNGTFTSSASDSAGTRPATTITGQGSGATFSYAFDASGNLSSITADGAGQDYLEGDQLSITTTAAHGSQTIKFRLVKGSNEAETNVTLIHDRTNPLAFPVRKYKVLGNTARTVLVLKERV